MSKLLKSKILLGVLVVVAMFAVVGFSSPSKAAADCSITVTLRVGSTGEQVKCLQTVVGATADGNFGPLTKASVMAWQSGHGLVADGVFGPKSNAVLLGLGLGGTYPAGCSSNSGYSSTTGLPCSGGFPAGCSSSVGYSSTTGQPCSGGSTNLPAGCTSTSGYSTTTGQACSGTIVNANGEGSVAVTFDAIPANNLVVNKGETKDVMALKIKATGSDMNVSRVWLDLNARIWLSASEASVWDGSTALAVVPLSASTVLETTTGSAWQLQFNGLNVTVPVGTTKVLTVKITRPTLTSASAAIVAAATSSVRATDAAGFSTTYTFAARDINLTGTAAATDGTLTATLNINSPVAQSVSGLSATAGTLTPVKLMDFDLKATTGPINVSLISGTATSTGTIAEDVASLELRDGVNVLASVTGAGTFSFQSLNIDIPADTTKTLSIWAKVNHIAASYVVKGDGINVAVTAVTATTGPSFTSASITPTVTGFIQYLFRYAPTLTVGATSAVQVEGSAVGKKAANLSLAFNVTAPSGSDIYVNFTDGTLCGGTYPATKIGNAACSSTTIGGTMTTAVTVSGAASKGTGTLATWDKVAAGSTRTFTITGYVPDGNTAGFTGLTMATNGLQWTDTDNITISGVASTEQTWGMADFKTGTVNVTA